MAASMGLGGGAFLIIYLTVFAGVGQLEAQGINLLFFIPIAAAAVFFHAKKGLVEWRSVFPAAVFGAAGAFLCAMAARRFDPRFLSQLFGAFILISGISGLLSDTGGAKDTRRYLKSGAPK